MTIINAIPIEVSADSGFSTNLDIPVFEGRAFRTGWVIASSVGRTTSRAQLWAALSHADQDAPSTVSGFKSDLEADPSVWLVLDFGVHLSVPTGLYNLVGKQTLYGYNSEGTDVVVWVAVVGEWVTVPRREWLWYATNRGHG